MTLGGLALAVGILMDDATVTFENITWHLEQGKDVEPAILDGAQQIVGPAFVLKGQIAAVAPRLHEPKQAVSPACPRFR